MQSLNEQIRALHFFDDPGATMHGQLDKAATLAEQWEREHLEELKLWQRKALDAGNHPAVKALLEERDEARDQLTALQAELAEAKRERDAARAERNIMLRWLQTVDGMNAMLGLRADASPEYTLKVWTEQIAALRQE